MTFTSLVRISTLLHGINQPHSPRNCRKIPVMPGYPVTLDMVMGRKNKKLKHILKLF